MNFNSFDELDASNELLQAIPAEKTVETAPSEVPSRPKSAMVPLKKGKKKNQKLEIEETRDTA